LISFDEPDAGIEVHVAWRKREKSAAVLSLPECGAPPLSQLQIEAPPCRRKTVPAVSTIEITIVE
jgi:hypothetical protein